MKSNEENDKRKYSLINTIIEKDKLVIKDNLKSIKEPVKYH